MAAARKFRVPDSVIHQTLDGEAVVINLDNGRYYSFNDCGSLVWNALAAGYSFDAITQALATAAAENASIERFVNELVGERLLEQTAAELTRPPATALPAAKFTEPRMEIYKDMELLLPLDPLHEVDERGWPNRKTSP
jgi:hypothetical protein